MRLRNQILLTVMAVAVLGITPTVVSASSPVEVHDELAAHCAPCLIEVHGESQITSAAGIPVSTCEDTFHAEIYEDGSGHVTELINAPHAGLPCTTIKCTGVGEPAEEAEWPFQIKETPPNEGMSETLEMRFCLDVFDNPGGAGVHCDLDAHIGEEPAPAVPHHYEISTTNFPCAAGARLVTGNWEIEGTPIEIDHPHTPVEVHDESGAHCNPCPISLDGESQITNTAGTPVSTCEDELSAEIYEDGSGHVTEYHNDDNHDGLPCTVQNCNGVGEPPAESEWPLQAEEAGPSEEALELRLCLDTKVDPNATGVHCDIEADISNLGNHHYEISLVNELCHNATRLVNATWEIQSSPIEIEHPDV